MAPVSSTAIKPSNIHKLKAISTAGFARKMYEYSVLLTKLSLVRSSEALQMNRNKITLFVRLNAFYCKFGYTQDIILFVEKVFSWRIKTSSQTDIYQYPILLASTNHLSTGRSKDRQLFSKGFLFFSAPLLSKVEFRNLSVQFTFR